MTSLIAANCSCLQQGSTLLGDLPEGLFAEFHPASPEGSIGAHMRHCIDHFDCFLKGLGQGEIDYDNRDRRLDLEQDPQAAIPHLQGLIAELMSLCGEWDRDRVLKVRSGTLENGDHRWLPSSLGRELQFLLSHTIHHFALIAMLLRLAGITPPKDFGVAPSTLHHWESMTPCAQ